jgi:hypothetical protein
LSRLVVFRLDLTILGLEVSAVAGNSALTGLSYDIMTRLADGDGKLGLKDAGYWVGCPD